MYLVSGKYVSAKYFRDGNEGEMKWQHRMKLFPYSCNTESVLQTDACYVSTCNAHILICRIYGTNSWYTFYQ